MGKVLFIAKRVFHGIVVGVVYYILYLVALPSLLTAVQIPVYIPPNIVFYLGFFIALGTAESILANTPFSIPLRILSKLLGALILWTILNGGHLSGSIEYSGTTVFIEIDISLLLYVIVLASLIYGFMDVFTYFSEHR
ncbi:MAG: hypothetical protein ABWW65_05825 [Thermoprotei archaeon]